MEGDNHSKSMDSNMFGPVAVGLITAQAKCVIWPPKRWKCLTSAIPPDRSTSVLSTIPFKGSYSSGTQLFIELKNQQRYFDWRTIGHDGQEVID